jgi:hypothetical protein
MRIIAYIALIAMITQTNLFAADCFPEQSVSYSPNKRYSIIWKEPTDGEKHHLLINNGTEKKVFFEFIRSACICWEPTSEHFALTYHAGSNVSEAYIYSSTGPRKQFDVLDIIPRSTKKLYVDNFHSYIEVISWTKSGLFVHVWEHGDSSPEGFDENLACMKKGAEWQCVRHKRKKGTE